METIRDSIDALEGSAAPPRKNGELVFDAPWQSRAFGMAVALREQGAYDWGEFSARLAQVESQVARHKSQEAGQLVSSSVRQSPEPEAQDSRLKAQDSQQPSPILPAAPDAEDEYYERWLEALQRLLIEKGLLERRELERRTAEFAAGMWDDH